MQVVTCMFLWGDINEITLFRHFKTKQGLWDSILKHLPLSSAFTDELFVQMQQLTLREALMKLAAEWMNFLEQQAVMLRLQLMDTNKKYREGDIPRGTLRKSFTEYLLNKQISSELSPDFGPKQAADVFLAGISGYVIAYQVLIPSERPQSAEHFMQTHVDIFLKGVINK